MARMIPSLVSGSTPRGEKQLFSKLRDDPSTRDWLVFHSLDIKRHIIRSEGEADMLIIIPNQGVLCIEVKGCGVSRKDGVWTYAYDPPKTSTVGPFRQASDALHSIREYLSHKDASLSKLLYQSAVLFTEVDFNERSLEWEPWQVIDRSSFLRKPISASILEVMNRAHARIKNLQRLPSWYGHQSRPTVVHMKSILRLLRSDFEFFQDKRNLIESTESATKRFTEEQFEVLDHLEDNERVIFKGPAGTGKTLMALECTRRALEKDVSVALLCFNNLLASWLKDQTAFMVKAANTNRISSYIGGFSALLLSIAKIKVPHNADEGFWRTYLPNKALEALLDSNCEMPTYDFLVIDEAQDLLSESYLDVMDVLLKGGLATGRWAMFGDFERQSIYVEKNINDNIDVLQKRTGNSASIYRLRINCRNTSSIAEAVTLTSGLSPGYSKVLNSQPSEDVEPAFYRNKSDQCQLLERILLKLLEDFPPQEIVVLSMKSDTSSCGAMLAKESLKIKLAPYREACSKLNAIRYSSTHSFKGLEASAVVLTDIESIEEDQAKALLYVGMSRARVSLYILMKENLRSAYDETINKGLRAALKTLE